jgi:phasin family protein
MVSVAVHQSFFRRAFRPLIQGDRKIRFHPFREATMYQVSEQLAKVNQAGVETLSMIANAAFASGERLVALNLNTARMFLADSLVKTRAMLTACDTQDFTSLAITLARPGLQEATAYSRRVREIATETGEALSRVVNNQVLQINPRTTLDKAARTQ